MAKILIKGGRVVDPANKIDKKLDILIDQGKIQACEENIKAEAKIIKADGLIVAPGLIDMHAHLREPGREDKETIKSASQAAASSGITSLCSMPNTDPVCDESSVVEYILDKAKEAGLSDVYPIGAITKGLKGERLSEMFHLAEAGAVAFSDDGNCVQNSLLMRKALEYSKIVGLPIIIHAEDSSLSAGGLMNEGYFSTRLGLQGIPKATEEVIISRDIALAELTGAKVHFAHLSSAGSVELVRQAKKKGLKVTAEVTPHHLFLDDSLLVSYDTNLKVNPPLRSKDDQESLIEGLKDGTIDCVASDHAPHANQEKEVEFSLAQNGVIGLETLLPLVIDKLAGEKLDNLSGLLAKLTTNPARILNIDKGTLTKGKMADIFVFDPNTKVKVDPKTFYSKSKNTPFAGMELKGKPMFVFKAGRLVSKEGKLV